MIGRVGSAALVDEGGPELNARQLLLAIAILVSWAVQGPAAAQYALQPGDTLQLSVWQEPRLDRQIVVAPDGTIRWVLGQGQFVYDEHGQALRMYGVVSDLDPVPWEWVEAQLTDAPTYWVVPAGHPHPRPVWGVWVDGELHLSIGSLVVSRALRDDPAVAVHLDSGVDVVIVEGVAGDDIDLVDPATGKHDDVPEEPSRVATDHQHLESGGQRT